MQNKIIFFERHRDVSSTLNWSIDFQLMGFVLRTFTHKIYLYSSIFSLVLSNVLLLEVISLSRKQTPLSWISKKKILAFPFYSTSSIFCLHLFSPFVFRVENRRWTEKLDRQMENKSQGFGFFFCYYIRWHSNKHR